LTVSAVKEKAVGDVRQAILPAEGGCTLLIEVQPGSSRPGRLSYDPWRKRIRLAVGERAREGRANAEVLAVLASVLGVPEGSLRIASGQTDRRKSVEVLGVGPAEAFRRTAPLLEGG
jgi:uncharacterized protein (TIGR00251 family)